MKSKIITLVLLITAMSCHAQNQLEDVERDGMRIVSAPLIKYGNITECGSWVFGVNGTRKKGSTAISYTISIGITGTNHTVYPDYPGVLIRFATGKVIELKAVNVMDIDIENYLGVLVLPVTEAQLRMFKSGVRKTRVEHKHDYSETIHDYGQEIYAGYEAVKAQFSKPPKTYADGF